MIKLTSATNLQQTTMHYGFTATALEQQFSSISLITNVSLIAADEPWSPGPAHPDSRLLGTLSTVLMCEGMETRVLPTLITEAY